MKIRMHDTIARMALLIILLLPARQAIGQSNEHIRSSGRTSWYKFSTNLDSLLQKNPKIFEVLKSDTMLATGRDSGRKNNNYESSAPESISSLQKNSEGYYCLEARTLGRHEVFFQNDSLGSGAPMGFYYNALLKVNLIMLVNLYSREPVGFVTFLDTVCSNNLWLSYAWIYSSLEKRGIERSDAVIILTGIYCFHDDSLAYVDMMRFGPYKKR